MTIGKGTILVVEDKEFFRKALVDGLKGNYKVFEAITGVDAIKKLLKLKPDIIILNMGLPWREGTQPNIIGIDLLEIIKDIDSMIQVIIITGTTKEVKVAVEAMKKGAIDYILREDIDIEKIKETINEALQKRNNFLDMILKELSIVELSKVQIEIDKRIKEELTVEYTFLDIDVVGSSKMKDNETITNIIYSFNEYYKYIQEKTLENNGKVLNAIGDEVMCYFKDPNDAINAGINILNDRKDFNNRKNTLKKQFQFRIGINTGVVVGDKEGKGDKIIGTPLDIAGHLQKKAKPGEILISKNTYNKLAGEKKNMFKELGYIQEKEQIQIFSNKDIL